MAQNYEMMYILPANLAEEQLQEQIAKYRNILTEYGAEQIETKILGKKRLAYPIKKNRTTHQEGFYILLNYTAFGKQVAPVERAMRLSEEVIRYLTIKLDEVKPEPVEVAEVADEVAA